MKHKIFVKGGKWVVKLDGKLMKWKNGLVGHNFIVNKGAIAQFETKELAAAAYACWIHDFKYPSIQMYIF